MGDVRIAPQNIEAEQALLGAIFVNNSAFYAVVEFLEAEHFNEPIHQQIFKISSDLIRAGKKANPVTLKNFMPVDQMIGELTAIQYLARLSAEATNVYNAKDYGLAIYDSYVSRMSVIIGQQLIENGYSYTVENSPIKLVTEAIDRLNDISVDPLKNSNKTGINSIAQQAIDEMASAYQNNEVRGIEFPLDEMTFLNQGPMEAGNLYGLVGGTKEGKSSLTAQIIKRAIDDGNPVLVLSYDQTGVQWLRQMAAQDLGIGANKQRKGGVDEKEFGDISEYFELMNGKSFEIIKCNQENADRLCAYTSRFLKKIPKDNTNVPLIIVDHVGKIPAFDTKMDAGKQAGAINQRIKGFIGENDVAWLNLIQRNSGGSVRENPRPIKKDIYGGEGAIADYDAILYIYRAEKWLQDQLKTCLDSKREKIEIMLNDRKGLAEIGLIAHRFAPDHLTKDVRFIARLTKYETLIEQPNLGDY